MPISVAAHFRGPPCSQEGAAPHFSSFLWGSLVPPGASRLACISNGFTLSAVNCIDVHPDVSFLWLPLDEPRQTEVFWENASKIPVEFYREIGTQKIEMPGSAVQALGLAALLSCFLAHTCIVSWLGAGVLAWKGRPIAISHHHLPVRSPRVGHYNVPYFSRLRGPQLFRSTASSGCPAAQCRQRARTLPVAKRGPADAPGG